jgi:serine/threonine protein kinase
VDKGEEVGISPSGAGLGWKSELNQKRGNLQLVDNARKRAKAPLSNVIPLASLSPGETHRLERLFRQIDSAGTLLGVLKTNQAWDLRPIVEENGELFLVRLFGPEVTLSLAETDRAQRFITTLMELPFSGAELVQQGMIDGQIFVRRPIFQSTLDERLSSNERFSFRSALGIALEVIRILRLWHENGIFHGHLVPSNICFSSLGEIAVVDAAIRLGQIRASKELGISGKSVLLEEKYLAPEVIQGGNFGAASDVFALGHLFQDLFRRVKRRPAEATGLDAELEWVDSQDLEALRELLSNMTDEHIEARPPLEYVERLLESRSFREEQNVSAHTGEGLIAERSQEELLRDIEQKLFDGDVSNWRSRRVEAPIEAPPPERESFRNPSIEFNRLELGLTETSPVESATEGAADGGVQVSSQDGSFLKYAVVALSLLCAVLAWRLFYASPLGDFSDMTDSDLMAAWESAVPSEMSLVAAAAIQSPESGNAGQQKMAERLILRSAFSEGRVSDLINYPLIRQAFDQRWEKRLSPRDRRVALTIAVRKLVGERALPKEKVDLNSIHPGVLLAVLSVLGNVPGVSEVPAAKLTTLPPPLNFAFQQIVEANPNALCGDPAILGLARIQGKEVLSADDVLPWLQDDTELRLRAVSILLADSRLKAQQLIELLLNHPNLTLDHDIIRWGIKMKLNTWSSHPPTDQLFILAGIKPPSELSRLEYVQLLAHPVSKMRKLAIDGVINSIPLAHPGAVPFFNRLKENPDLLGGNQTLEIAQFLEKPDNVTREAMQTWCSSRPNPSLIADLLAATSDRNTATAFDANLSLCLQQSAWEPTVDQLRRLSHHPDSLTRVFIYTKLLELGGKEPALALEIFTDALVKEPREDLRKQLELNISSLRLK